ncbi:MAG: hypothetical protein ACAI38_04660 [Myxococcota bacterium]|nr:hypothetical protein [Myxococcota bacterium]
MTNSAGTVVYRHQWDSDPTLAANYAAHRILDAASKHTSVTVDEAKQGIADVIGYALSHPDRFVQDNAMNHFVIPTIQSNGSLIGFGMKVNAAWRSYTDARNAVMNPAVMAALGADETAMAAALAGARQTFDTSVAALVDEYVGHLSSLPPPSPAIDAYCAAAGAAAVRSFTEWQVDEGRRLAGLPPREK